MDVLRNNDVSECLEKIQVIVTMLLRALDEPQRLDERCIEIGFVVSCVQFKIS